MSKIFNISLYDQITFDNRIGTNQHLISIIDIINFSDAPSFAGAIYIYDTLFFHQHLTVVEKIKAVHLSENINFQEILSFTIIPTNINKINQTITFTQTLGILNQKIFLDNISFVDTVAFNLNRHISLTQSLVFKQFTSGYKISHKPNLTIDQILTDPIVVFPRSEVTFTQADGKAFGLFRLSFGNEYTTQYNHIQHESMGRTLILAGNDTYSYRQSVKSLKMTFEYQKEQDLDSFMAFLNNNLGLPITLQDHEGITYNGFINTPEAELIQEDRNNRKVEFSFEILAVIPPPSPPIIQ